MFELGSRRQRRLVCDGGIVGADAGLRARERIRVFSLIV